MSRPEFEPNEVKERELFGHNIMIYSSSLPGTIGGIQTCNQALIEKVVSQGASVCWVYPRTEKSDFENIEWVNNQNSKVQFLPLEPENQTKEGLNRASDIAIKEWQDHLCLHNDTEILINMPSNFGEQIANSIPQNLIPKTTLWFHGMIDLSEQALSSFDTKLYEKYKQSEDTREKWKKSFRTLSDKGFKFVLVSERVRESFLRNEVLKPDDYVEVLPPPSDMCHECQGSQREKITDIRNGFDMVSTTVMRIEPRKGIENLFHLGIELESQLTDNRKVKFIIVGADQNSSYSDLLKTNAYTLNQRLGAVHFEIVEAKTGQALCDYYNASDFFTMPSITESFGLVVVEAASHGLPVISWGEQDTLKSVNRLNELGYSIPCELDNIHLHDKEGAKFIIDLMNDPLYKTTIGEKAKEIVLKTQNKAEILNKLISIIINK